MRKLLVVLLIGWAIAFFGSFAAFYLTPAKDFGLSGGWNKVGVFMGWQGAATALALACLIVRWSISDAGLRRLAAIPAVGLGLMILAIGALFFWANMQRTPPEGSAPLQNPTTAPVASEAVTPAPEAEPALSE